MLALPIFTPMHPDMIGGIPALLRTYKIRPLLRTGFVLALPIFTPSHPGTIVGTHELNFCVRNGNRWTLAVINTNCQVVP